VTIINELCMKWLLDTLIFSYAHYAANILAEYRNLCENLPTSGAGSDNTAELILTNPDVCHVFDGLCPHGKCVAIPGSYRCDCFRGFKLDQQGQCSGLLTVICEVKFASELPRNTAINQQFSF
jgi:hypothetical protein